MSYLDEAVAAVREWDERRPRSRQKEVGWSGMSACRSWLGFKIRGDWPSDDEENWRAIAGTALHELFRTIEQDEAAHTGRDVEFEREVGFWGVPGHADRVDWPTGTITDWKFPSKASARIWDDPEVLDEKFIQVQGYAAGLFLDSATHVRDEWRRRAGTEEPRVQMLVCPVDGKFTDWRLYERDFDFDVVLAAVERYQSVRDMITEDVPIPLDKPWWWCSSWCEMFTACRGGNSQPELETVTDPETAAAIEAYGLAREAATAAEQVMKDVAPLLRGGRGSARGFRVSMTREGQPRDVVDDDLVAATFDEHGWQVPLLRKPGRPASLRVTREKE